MSPTARTAGPAESDTLDDLADPETMSTPLDRGSTVPLCAVCIEAGRATEATHQTRDLLCGCDQHIQELEQHGRAAVRRARRARALGMGRTTDYQQRDEGPLNSPDYLIKAARNRGINAVELLVRYGHLTIDEVEAYLDGDTPARGSPSH